MKKIIALIAITLISFSAFSQKYYQINGSTIVNTAMPTSYTSIDGKYWHKNYKEAPESVHYADHWRIEVTPEYDVTTQYLGDLYYNVGMDYVTRDVIDKSAEQIAAEQEAYLQAIESQLDVKKVKYLIQKLAAPMIDTMSMDSTDINAFISIYDQWRIGKYYEANAVVVKDSNLFRIIQAHTSQSDWLPGQTPALYQPYRVPGTVTEFKPPTAENPYNIGDKVRFEGKTYESLIDGNVWSPAQYPAGWTLIG